MAKQLDLTIAQKLAYDPQGFLLHQGVREIADHILALPGTAAYPLLSILGDRRSGKTHFGIYLAEQFGSKEISVRYFEGVEFLERLPELHVQDAEERQLLIVDDADTFLPEILPGDSGKLVGVIEKLRATGGFLLLLRKLGVEEYSFDDHLKSRFNAGQEFTIGSPGRDEVRDLLKVLMHQRGLRLPERKIEYLSKRLGCAVAEIESYLERMSSLAQNRGVKIDFPVMSEAL